MMVATITSLMPMTAASTTATMPAMAATTAMTNEAVITVAAAMMTDSSGRSWEPLIRLANEL